MSQKTIETDANPLNVVTAKSPRLQRKSYSYLEASLRRFMGSRLNVASLALFVLIAIITALAPLISGTLLNTSPEYFSAANSIAYAPPGNSETLRDGSTIIHWLGTDDLGRDTLARLVHAGGASISIGLLVTLIIILIGVPVGLLSGFLGGWVDDLANAVIQIINNIPSLYLFLVLAGIFRPNLIFLSLIFGLLSWTPTARQVRGLTLSLRSRDFTLAAIVMGAGYMRLMLVHLLPNIVSILLVLIGTDIAGAMLGEAALSYLGFGIRDPDISWGKMLSSSSQYLTYRGNHNPFLIIGPGVMIFLTVLSVYLIADGLRDAFDPTLKQ